MAELTQQLHIGRVQFHELGRLHISGQEFVQILWVRCRSYHQLFTRRQMSVDRAEKRSIEKIQFYDKYQ